ncbi:MAG TPA: D-2-hydroxyacid dehydrogenase [Ramlibacter sp.]|nr:D-2-hydroxyacid dehydrogenase [Ramlibacter sp.]
MSSEKLAILVSEEVASVLAQPLQELTRGRASLRVQAHGQALAESALLDVQAAFHSVDLMTGSNKQAPNPRLAAFGAAIAAAPRLRWLHTCAAGTDRPLMQAAMRRGVTVTSSSGANAVGVAQCALAGMLALARDVPAWVRDRDQRRWSLASGFEHAPADLEGQHAVVVGLGPIGVEMARLCRALRLRVTGIRNRPLPEPACDAVATLSELPHRVADADWLVLCCPLTPQTRGLVDAALLATLKPGARLVNVARGEVVVEPDLFDALRARRLGGAYTDVMVDEPPPEDSPWWTLPNVLLSPHVAGLTQGFAARTQAMFLDNLVRWLDGQPLRNVARPTA